MPIAANRCAIALPMRPKPRMPTFLPPSLVVSSGPCFSHVPARTNRSAFANPRPVISTSPTATSATSSVSTSGVLVTLMLRCRQ